MFFTRRGSYEQGGKRLINTPLTFIVRVILCVFSQDAFSDTWLSRDEALQAHTHTHTTVYARGRVDLNEHDRLLISAAFISKIVVVKKKPGRCCSVVVEQRLSSGVRRCPILSFFFDFTCCLKDVAQGFFIQYVMGGGI